MKEVVIKTIKCTSCNGKRILRERQCGCLNRIINCPSCNGTGILKFEFECKLCNEHGELEIGCDSALCFNKPTVRVWDKVDKCWMQLCDSDYERLKDRCSDVET